MDLQQTSGRAMARNNSSDADGREHLSANERIVLERGVSLVKCTQMSYDGILISVEFRRHGQLHRDHRDGPARLTFYADGSTRTIEFWENGGRSALCGAAYIEYGGDANEVDGVPLILSIIYAHKGLIQDPLYLQCEGDRRYPLRSHESWALEPALTYRNYDGTLAQTTHCRNGLMHCEHGPAFVNYEGPDNRVCYVEYRLDGARVSEAQWRLATGRKPARQYRYNHLDARMPGSVL